MFGVAPRFFDTLPTDRWGLQPLSLILPGLVSVLMGGHGNGCVTSAGSQRKQPLPCLLEHLWWGPEWACTKWERSEAATLWGSQATQRGRVWHARVGQQPELPDAPAEAPGVSGVSGRVPSPALLNRLHPVVLPSWGPRHHGTAISSVCCPNSWPTTCMIIIKRSLQAANL